MFNELYKRSMDEVKPDEILVQRTKKLMHKEIKNKHKKLYKYVTAAACLIITFSLFRVTFNSSKNISNTQDALIGEIGELNGGVPISNTSPIPNQGDFTGAGSYNEIKGFFSADVKAPEGLHSQSSDNLLVRIIKGIFSWFRNLFN